MQRLCDARQYWSVSCGFWKHPRPGGRRPIRVMNGERERAGHLAVRSQLPTDVNGKSKQRATTHGSIDLMPIESQFSAGRLGQSVRYHACPIDTMGPLVHKTPHLDTEDPLQGGLRSPCHLTDTVQSVLAEHASRLQPHSIQGPYWLWIQEAGYSLWGIRDTANGTRQSVMPGHPGEHGIGSHTDSTVKAVQRQHAHTHKSRNLNSVAIEIANAPTHIRQCCVGRNGRDNRGDVTQNLKECLPCFPRRLWCLNIDNGHLDHPALPGLECQNLRPSIEPPPAGLRSAHGSISTPLAT